MSRYTSTSSQKGDIKREEIALKVYRRAREAFRNSDNGRLEEFFNGGVVISLTGISLESARISTFVIIEYQAPKGELIGHAYFVANRDERIEVNFLAERKGNLPKEEMPLFKVEYPNFRYLEQ